MSQHSAGIEAGLPTEHHQHLASEIGLDAATIALPSDLASPRPMLPYLSMSKGEFPGVDWSTSTTEERVRYLMMKVRMVRPDNELPEAVEYFDRIQASYLDSFETVTPETLDNPDRMNLIRCVDPYEDKQLDELRIPQDQQIRVPGGLGWLDVTGLMENWAIPRIFKSELAAGVHRNCGGFAILGALTGERQVMHRNRAVETATRTFAETAAAVRQRYLQIRKGKVDPEVAEALSNFGGPKLTITTGPRGTAEDFITPKTTSSATVDVYYRPSEIVNHVDAWVDKTLSSSAGE